MKIEFKIENGINKSKKWYDLKAGIIANEKIKTMETINNGRKFFCIFFNENIPNINNGINTNAK